MHPGFALALVFTTLILTVGYIVRSWIEARYGRRTGDADELHSARHIELLSSENASLKGQLGRLEERISVLERIATDPAERTAREIDQLR
jgi:hypothetical protein